MSQSSRDNGATYSDGLVSQPVTKNVRRTAKHNGKAQARAEVAHRTVATLRARASALQRAAEVWRLRQVTALEGDTNTRVRGQAPNEQHDADRVSEARSRESDSKSEPASADAQVEIGEQLSAISPEDMGWFRFYFDDQRWEWSEQVQRLHGYQPGTVTPTTDLVLSHKHPDDRDKVAATIDNITHTRGALSSRHRIIDANGTVRWVVIIGDQFFDDNDAAIGTHGFYVDATPAERAREAILTAKVDEIAAKRAPIEHAKGMLMLIYDINEEVAFNLLKWLSQDNNVKIRALAEQVCTNLRAAARTASLDKTVFDHALMTAPQHLAG